MPISSPALPRKPAPVVARPMVTRPAAYSRLPTTRTRNAPQRSAIAPANGPASPQARFCTASANAKVSRFQPRSMVTGCSHSPRPWRIPIDIVTMAAPQTRICVIDSGLVAVLMLRSRSNGRAADAIDQLDRRRVERQRGGADQLGELRRGGRAGDRCGDAGTRDLPGERDLRRRRADGRRDRVERAQDREAALVQVLGGAAAANALAEIGAAAVLAGQKAARQRVEVDDAD